ncbi:Aste57867_21606 [Aphanomyces stellatus]|uniref:Aste57867_21606 protein n=1 Tax=Aphanomyces stellatus TaxID=120398 RepID=A0A485LHZ8_9STRA|nr:hypothetical protein As57867_021537 [Aphanomyces stellatus]VFT98276.1 Aste57867_21606 [Aphanomyces stellatus]
MPHLGSWTRVLAVLWGICTTQVAATSTFGISGGYSSVGQAYQVTCTGGGACGTLNVVLSVTRTAASLTNLESVTVTTIPYTTLSLSANATVDYTPITGVAVLFNPGDTAHTVTIPVLTSGQYAQTTYFGVQLSAPSSGAVVDSSSGTAYVAVVGAVGAFSFGSSNYTFLETAGVVSIPVVRTGGTCGAVTIPYALANNGVATATSGTNFVLGAPSTVVFRDGQATAFISVTIIHTPVYEYYSLYFVLNLGTPMGGLGALAASPTSTYVFLADAGDAGIFQFTASYTYCREDNLTAIVVINRTVGTSTSTVAPVLLTVATIPGGNATQGSSRAFDYEQTAQVLSWADGEQSKTFSVPIFNNALYQPLARTVYVAMTAVSGGASIGQTALNTTTIFIVDDRDAGTFSFQSPNYTVVENAGVVTLPLLRTGKPDPSGINTYTSGNVSVDVYTYTGVVLPGLPAIAAGYDYGVVANLRCTHTSPCSAVAGVHYTALPVTTLTFADGVAALNVSIPILNNNFFEAPSRVFKVLLQNVQGGAFIGLTAGVPSTGWDPRIMLPLDPAPATVPNNIGTVVTILDDGDPAVLLGKASTTTSELGQVDTYTIGLNAAPTAAVTVALTLDNTQAIVAPNQAVFTPANWRTPQTITVYATANNVAEGTHAVHVAHAATSADSNYNGAVRLTLGGAGVVYGRSIYTEGVADYNQGDDQHVMSWSAAANGVMTAPSVPIVNDFILDANHAAVQITPEAVRPFVLLHVISTIKKVRHVLGAPTNFVCARTNGHVASVTLTLSSQPTANVVLTLTSPSASVVVSPAVVTLAPAQWATGAAVAVTYTGTGSVTTTQVAVASTSADVLYASANSVFFFVVGYSPAAVVLNQSQATFQENGPAAHTDYAVGLASEPLHWEKPSLRSTPFTLAVAASDDRTIVSSTGLVPPGGPLLLVATNGSESTALMSVQKVSLVRFPLAAVPVTTGSARVGLALLRLYRVAGGDNQGLGGLQLGVVATSTSWNASVACDAACTLNVLPQNVPFGVLGPANRDLAAGLVDVMPQGAFNSSLNAYVSASGGVELDVTSAWNTAATAGASEITFILYVLRQSSSVVSKVDEIQLASTAHPTAAWRPTVRLTSSGLVNLAATDGVATQSDGTANASQPLVGNPTPMGNLGWWQVDWGTTRTIEAVVVQVVVPTPTTFPLRLMLDGNRTQVLTVASTAAGQTVQVTWHVHGQAGGAVNNAAYRPSSTTAEARTLLLASNASYSLTRVQVFQVPMAATRVSIGAYLPSPSVLTASQNQLHATGDDPLMADATQCDARQICRNELLFTAGQWSTPQTVHVDVTNDNVATGTRVVGVSHAALSADPDYDSVTQGGFCTASPSSCTSPLLQPTLALSVQDDDQAAVVVSTNAVSLVEGALNYPGAPVPVRVGPWQPMDTPRCSWNNVTQDNTSCLGAFRGSVYQACLVPNAPLFANGSSWVLVRVPASPPALLLRQVTVQLVANTAMALQSISVWTNDAPAVGGSGWQLLQRQANVSFGQPTVVFTTVTAALTYIAVQVEASYDPITNCVAIASIQLQGDVPIRDNSASVSTTQLSRTHQTGTPATVTVQLLSEPLAEVVVVPQARSTQVIAYDRSNATKNAASVETIRGGVYSYATYSAMLPTALHFNASNWNVPQTLELSAVDDNIFTGNRTTSTGYTTSSLDPTATFQQSVVTSTSVALTTTVLPAACQYSGASFVVSPTLARAATWPYHVLPTVSLPPPWPILSIGIAITEDDLPGFTLSPAPLVVVENDTHVFNYSVVLDSQPVAGVSVQVTVVGTAPNAQPSLVSIQPTALAFTPANWFTPQSIYVVAPYTPAFEGNVSSTVYYAPTVPKKHSELMVAQAATSADAAYNGLGVGTNDPTAVYSLAQGMPLIVLDIDTGCTGNFEYACANAQPCVQSPPFGARCNCSGVYGMRDCTASCATASSCTFARVQFLVACSPSFPPTAACAASFSPVNLVTQLHFVLASTAFTAPDGTTYAKLTRDDMASSLYLAHAALVVDPVTGTPAMQVVVDLADTGPTFPALAKLQAAFAGGLVDGAPLYASALQPIVVVPITPNASIVLWVFVGLIAAGGAAAGALLVVKYRLKIQPAMDTPAAAGVAPHGLDDPNDLVHNTTLHM